VRILLVDDEEDVRRLARLSLEAIGRYEVDVASSAREGIERARATPCDLIMLDVVMPDLDGLAALALLREDPALRTIPVVLLTARARPDEERRYLALGARGVIAKPFDPMTLSDQVRRLLAQG